MNYSNNPTDLVAIGSNSTTTAKYWFDPNTQTAFLSGLSTLSNLLVTGSSTLQNFTGLNATTTNATSTSLFATTLRATNLTLTNALGVTYGGTGLSSYTLGDILYASGATTLAGTSTANLKTSLALNNVENTALSTWAGSMPLRRSRR